DINCSNKKLDSKQYLVTSITLSKLIHDKYLYNLTELYNFKVVIINQMIISLHTEYKKTRRSGFFNQL
uniref:hypothetical protein n=1 Tax=Yersinia rochesterensis TaxID=1604335 RepID=UPI001C93F8A1